jgi:pyruvate dehydrogenase E2 component (dihydrolipoamide acetyltransferase)
MATEITIPRLGWNMDEGVFVAWLKNDGDLVRAGEPIFSIENEKAVQEVESLDAGRLRIAPDGPNPGDIVTVGTVIGSLVRADEAAPAILIDQSRAVRSSSPASSPRARRKAVELGVEWTTVSGTGRGGRVRERDVVAAASARAARPATASQPALESDVRPEGEFEVKAIDPIRRAIAERMLRSHHETASVTLTMSIDATNLVGLRAQFKAVASRQESGTIAPIGYSDIAIKLAAMALAQHPLLNSCWDGERILVFRNIHIGLAVDADAGVLVPVIRDVPSLTLRQVAARVRDLVDRARRRGVTADELQGGTFTITNLGPFGIDAFTPIINPPQCAVLGLGRIFADAPSPGSSAATRHRMSLSLTFDHRIVDGAPAARFLQTLASLLEFPSPWLVS